MWGYVHSSTSNSITEVPSYACDTIAVGSKPLCQGCTWTDFVHYRDVACTQVRKCSCYTAVSSSTLKANHSECCLWPTTEAIHYLNLALVDSTKHVSDTADFFALMEILYGTAQFKLYTCIWIHAYTYTFYGSES